MERLSFESLFRTVQKCKEHDNYKVIVVVKYAEDKRSIWEYVQSECGCIQHQSIGKYNPKIEYPNGSCIYIISSECDGRGRRANLVLCDERIDDYEMICKLRVMEVNTHVVHHGI